MPEMLSLARAYAERYPATVAHILEDEEVVEISEFLVALEAGVSAEILANLSPVRAARCLDRLAAEEAMERLGRMTTRQVASVLRELPAERRRALLWQMPQRRRVQASLLLRQPRHTVGAWMETQVPNALSQATAENALKRIAGTSAYSSGVYVLGQNRRLVGWVSVDTLLRAERTTPVGDLMEHDVPRLGANTVLDTALGDSGWELSDVLPVIDREARLVGAIRYIDLRRAWLQAMHREGIDQRLDTLMDAMNHLYIGMAEIMDASIARRTVGGASRHEEPRR